MKSPASFLKKNRPTVLFATVIVLALLIAGGYAWWSCSRQASGPPPNVIVKSADGLAELSIPPSALPEGLTAADISIRKVTELPAAEGDETVPSAVYEFKPSGTVFQKPVQLKISEAITSKPDEETSVPLLFRLTENRVEYIEEAAVSIDASAKTRSARANITGFSFYGLVNGHFTVAFTAGPGIRGVGQAFDMPFIVRYKDEPVEMVYYVPGNPNAVVSRQTEEVTGTPKTNAYWSATDPYRPSLLADAPPLTPLQDRVLRHKEEFYCNDEGSGSITAEVNVWYDMHVTRPTYDPPDEFDVDFTNGKIEITHSGSCEAPEAEVSSVTTECGGSVTIEGTIARAFSDEVSGVDVFVMGPAGGDYVTADYDPVTRKFRLRQELLAARYDFTVAVTTDRTDRRHLTGEGGSFVIDTCPESAATMGGGADGGSGQPAAGTTTGTTGTAGTTDESDGGGQATMVEVPALVISGKTYPLGQFYPAECGNCASAHWHAIGNRPVRSIDLTERMNDPDPSGCGFGTTEELPPRNVKVPKDGLEKFQDATQ